ncbi:MAG: hypothetical protein JW984_15915 [Deltaproteobacteria bacterium]|uniref:Uncharacterized protein n=1 Tax=Candidatus Zymogenus saltonus TaxID=2844893 RepID=A0A9D8PPZ8_9DELT|nr:hypothetical protein [Candidatus Zymogenus saltonus]
MKNSNSIRKIHIILTFLVFSFFILVGLFSQNARASKIEEMDSTLGWNIQLRPSVLFGSDGRVLYVMDMNIPLYNGEDNLLFAAPKFTPNMWS